MYDGSSGKIHKSHFCEKAPAPDPMGDREIDQNHPENKKYQPGAHRYAIYDRPRHQWQGDNGKHQLIHEEHQEGDGQAIMIVNLKDNIA